MASPTRFEELPDELRRRLAAAGDLTDPRWSRARGLRSLATAAAAFGLLFLKGAWIVSACALPVAVFTGAGVLYRTWGFPRHREGRALAPAGLGLSPLALLLLIRHVWRVARDLDRIMWMLTG